MKKISLLFIAFTLLIFQQCHDSESLKPGVSTTQVVQEVKDWYGKGLTTNGSSFKSKTGFNSIALWNQAKTYRGKNKDKFSVIVPLQAYSEKQPQSQFHLITFRDKQKIQGFILQIIPDKDYLVKKSQTKDNLAFSGQIKIKSKTGKQMKTFKFKEGKSVPFIKTVSSTFRTMNEGDEDPTVDNGVLDEVVVIGYQPYDAYNDYTYLWLEDFSWGSSSSDEYSIDGWIHDYDGNGTTDIAIPISKGEDGISCASFNFVATTSNWQESAVKGVGFNVRYIDPSTNTIISRDMKIDRAIWFGLPINTFDNTNISPGKAAEIAAEAVQFASDLTHRLYIDNPSTSISTAESVFMGYLKSKLLMNGGRAGFYGSGSSDVVPTSASYNFFGNGDCD